MRRAPNVAGRSACRSRPKAGCWPSASTEAPVAVLSEKPTATGPFRSEAAAMARTWRQGYLRDPALRVLYV